MATKGILKYRITEKKHPMRPDDPGKFYAHAVHDRTVDFEDFVTHMSEHNSPYSRGVIHGVLIDMLSCLQELVLDGKSVRLGELGLFSLGISSEGADKASEWNASTCIRDIHLNVRNTKKWSNAELRKLCRLEELDAYEGSKVPGASGGSEEEVL